MPRNARRPDAVATAPKSPSEAAPAAATPAPPASGKDVVLLGPPTADGEGVHVLRARDERVEAGELRALREGHPVTGEIVSLQPRADDPRICDVKESYDAKTGAPAARKGPAQVATKAYRDNWDDIFTKVEPTTRPDPRTLN